MTFDKIFIKPVFGKSAYFPLLETTWRRVAGLRRDLPDSRVPWPTIIKHMINKIISLGKNSMQLSNCHHYVMEVMFKKEN